MCREDIDLNFLRRALAVVYLELPVIQRICFPFVFPGGDEHTVYALLIGCRFPTD